MEMFRYIRSRIPGAQEAKRADRDDYFQLNQTLMHGFPAKANCFSFDDQLGLLAIGTKTGGLRIYGAAGVEVTTEHPHETSVNGVFFESGVGRIVTHCSDSTLHRWSLVNTNVANEHRLVLQHDNEICTDSKLKTITASTVMCKDANHAVLLLGTETGNVHAVDMASLHMTDVCIYEEVVVQANDPPDEYRSSAAGHVEAMATRGNTLLIGYTRGLIIAFDTHNNTVINMYSSGQGVESLSIQTDGNKFISSHNDGSYVIWSFSSRTPLQTANIPFGPFPCKPIDRIAVTTLGEEEEEEVIVFTGGMPRASFGDKSTVAVQTTRKQLVFDCSSAVIDFVNIRGKHAHSLLILCEEELIAIDLSHEDWLPYRLPYLFPLHASPITACVHVPAVDNHVARALQDHRAAYRASKYSTRDWPITGGETTGGSSTTLDLLVTGHEDGHVRVWTCNQVSMQLLAEIQTARLFDAFAEESPAAEEDDWPPFRKTGLYDPYSDDPRVGVQRVAFDGRSGTLLVGGSAGHVIVYEMRENTTTTPHRLSCTIVGEEEKFTWKGNDAMAYVEREGEEECFEARAILQINPPAAISAVAMDCEKKILAAGTAHGFVVYDFARNEASLTKCLLSADDIAQHTARTFEGAMNRFKSFKKSVRDSIRRRRRTARAMSPNDRTAGPNDDAGAGSPPPRSANPSSPPRRVRIADPIDEVRPMERQIGGRCEPQNVVALPSLVRTIVFANTHIINATDISHTLWVGTNSGKVFAHVIEGDGEREGEGPVVTCTLAKEVHLRHGAPVLSIQILDEGDTPINGLPRDAVKGTRQHRIIICTEEQLKAFTLPSLRPTHYKYKLTAHEGVRMRRISTAVMRSAKDPSSKMLAVLVMTNNGTVHAFGCRQMRRFMHEQSVRDPNDIHAVLSTVLTSGAEVLSLTARGSEWVRSSLAANSASQLRARCHLPKLAAASTPTIEINEAEPTTEGDDVARSVHDTTVDSGQLNTTDGSWVVGDVTLDSIRDYTDNSSSHPANQGGQNGVETTDELINGTNGHCNGDTVEGEEVHKENDTQDDIGRLKQEVKEEMEKLGLHADKS